MSESTATSSNGASANGSAPPEGERLRLGGMALRNGLLIHGPTSWAVAARAADGQIEVASGPKPSLARGRLATTPLLRGPLRLAEAMAIVPLARMRLGSARLPFEDPVVVGVVAASVVGSSLLRRRGPATVGRELAIALIGALPALAALRDPALASYHAVEHKAIGGYEQGREPEEVPKEHQRCGSNLIFPMLAFSIAGQVLTERLFDDPGPLARGIAALAGVGGAVELFVFAERNPGSPMARAVHGPGYEIQRLVSTREPSPEQLEVGVAALQEVLRVEQVAADTV
ncbi:MAG: DUF1385 domain-containing protein [Vicinamibacteria bacterium]|jgi:uncharacterized protein YqhQ